MPDFIVRVYEPPDRVREHRVSAADASVVPAALAIPPVHVLSVVPASGGAGVGPVTPRWRGLGRRFPLRLFCQELAVLLDAGIPVLEALTTLREKEGDGAAASQALDRVLGALREGRGLSAALESVPQAFDPLTVAIVAASERSGQLADALREHARYLAWVDGLRAKLVGAAVYPALLLAAGFAVVLFLLLFVLPRFAGVLDGIGGDLPWASRALVTFGVAAGEHPGGLMAAVAVLAALAVAAWRHAGWRAALAGLAWRLPGMASRLRTLALAKCYRTLGLLLGAGVPIVAALRLVSGVAGSRWSEPLARLTDDVSAGLRLSEALERHGLATPVARRMVRVGERSGELPQMLERAAAFHDEEIARLADFIARVVNPLLMLAMGVVVGGIVVLMYLPIFSLVESVQ